MRVYLLKNANGLYMHRGTKRNRYRYNGDNAWTSNKNKARIFSSVSAARLAELYSDFDSLELDVIELIETR